MSRSPLCNLCFELVKEGPRLVRWSLVVRELSAPPPNWVDCHGLPREYQGPYTRPEAEKLYDLMRKNHGEPVRRVW